MRLRGGISASREVPSVARVSQSHRMVSILSKGMSVWSSVVTENYDKLYAIRAAVDTSPDEKVTPRCSTAVYRGLTQIRPPYSIIVLCICYDYYCILKKNYYTLAH